MDLQWHREHVKDRSTKVENQPTYDFLKNQVTSPKNLEENDLIRLYCGLWDEKHPRSHPDLSDSVRAYGKALRIVSNGVETRAEDGKIVHFIEVEYTALNLPRFTVDLENFALVPYPETGEWDALNAIQMLQKQWR